MKTAANFERARVLANKWPEWKRSYELTKDSARGSVHTPVTVAEGDSGEPSLQGSPVYSQKTK